jgi:hypothetical protein
MFLMAIVRSIKKSVLLKNTILGSLLVLVSVGISKCIIQGDIIILPFSAIFMILFLLVADIR